MIARRLLLLLSRPTDAGPTVPANALTLGGSPLTFDGQYLTL